MTQKEHLTVRLPPELLERVDVYRKKLERITRQPVSRAAAVRALIAAGLETEEK